MRMLQVAFAVACRMADELMPAFTAHRNFLPVLDAPSKKFPNCAGLHG